MSPYTGSPLSQPYVECDALNGESIKGLVVQAEWLDGPEFDLDAMFIVRTDDGDLIKVSGWNVDTFVIS